MGDKSADILMAAERLKKKVSIKHNGDLQISIGRTRFDTHWKNGTMKWSTLLDKLSKSVTTTETHAEYMRMGKEAQDKIKDIGGFVGGHLKEGKRRNGNVASRQIITLDLDFPPADLWEQIQDKLEPDLMHAMCLYSTHKHSNEKPRYRLILPLDRPVSADEYEAIARKIAEKIGMEYFDASTFQPTRLMYWPSNSSDVEPAFEVQDEDFLKADEVLAEYPDWTDVSYWPEPEGMSTARKKQAEKQGDPLTKKGLIGAFCRTYSIQEAIAAFLPDVYETTVKGDRYTYKAGSTAAGLVIYEDKFAFSNHSTDPASGQLCNAFDLVRIHKFGHLDEDAEPGKATTSMPSYKAMTEFVADDKGTKATIAEDRRKEAEEEFEKVPDAPADQKADTSWTTKLEVNKQGQYLANVKNCELILRNDPKLQGICYNEMSRGVEIREDAEPVPWKTTNKYWRNIDYSLLYGYLFRRYRVDFSDRVLMSAFNTVTTGRGFHPVREFIAGLPEWDEVPRVDDLFIRILGAPDTEYVRQVTRKTLVGCVQRALEPGCKFDTVLVLDGKPGIGKSTLLRMLGGKWFSDSLSLTDTRDKTAVEKLQGVWIMEIGEMQGTRKADVDILKGFISRQVDEYRPAYGRDLEHRPRMTVIFGTTNSDTGFLRDVTGNRRFWPVPVEGGEGPWGMTEDEVLQIWAEAMARLAEGETTYLDPEMEKEAEKMQQAALEYDDREGLVVHYLETLLPEDWYEKSLDERVDYFRDDELEKKEEGTMRRQKVSCMEIYCECFGKAKNSWKKQDGYDIASIMARIPGWDRGGAPLSNRDRAYGRQRYYVRKDGNK